MGAARLRPEIHHGTVMVESHVRQLTNMTETTMLSLRGGGLAGVLEAGERLCL